MALCRSVRSIVGNDSIRCVVVVDLAAVQARNGERRKATTAEGMDTAQFPRGYGERGDVRRGGVMEMGDGSGRSLPRGTPAAILRRRDGARGKKGRCPETDVRGGVCSQKKKVRGGVDSSATRTKGRFLFGEGGKRVVEVQGRLFV